MPKYPAKTYEDIERKKLDFDSLRTHLKLKQFEVKKNFKERFPKAHSFLKEKGIEFDKVRSHSAKVLSAGALSGSLLLSPVKEIKPLPMAHELVDRLSIVGGKFPIGGIQELLVNNLKEILPERARALSQNEEKLLEQVFEQVMGIKSKANLEGEHLNTTYGYIGAEQHLRRYPGDILSNHGEGDVLKEGIAPGLGAWGYFASNKDALSSSLEDKEKWYAVVQTLYLPEWESRQPYLRNWYKYRKVIIVNTNNGNAVVAAIADSGPAAWTGKHFGGSPEVMEYLGGERYKKGPVIVFFVDDPENKVPLGPVEYNKLSLPEAGIEIT